MSKSLGKRIRRARLENSWTQRDLAKKVDIAQSTISGFEQGEKSPDADQLKRLERHLGSLAKNPSRGVVNHESTKEGPALFGAWLSKSRQNMEHSVAELSGMSGVSMPTIYAIESGKIENPRRETIRKLEKALKKDTPQELIEEMDEEASIEGLGGLTDFDPHDGDGRPSVAGVYVLYDISDRPIYVGMGVNIGKRIAQHQDKFWFKEPIVETASYIEIKDDLLRRQVETLLIKFLKSNAVINKQNVER